MMNSAFLKEEKTYFAEKLEENTANPEKKLERVRFARRKIKISYII